jgi:hypothetical protein
MQRSDVISQAVRPLGVEPGSAFVSQALGMRLQRENNRLRLVNVTTSEPLLWPDEVAAARRITEERLLAAEDELAQLRAEVARLRQASSGDNAQD